MNNTDITINRITEYTELELPNAFNVIRIPPNEWVVYDTFNQSINKLLENYNYLESNSKIYDIPPNSEFTSWLGNDSISGEKWHIGSNDISDNIIGGLTSVNDVNFITDWMVIANNTTVQLISSEDNIDIDIFDEINETGIGQNFGVIKSIGVDSKNRIIVLDSDHLRIATLNYDIDYINKGKCSAWETIKIWGTWGTYDSNYGFRSMIDMVVVNDYVYILDNINNVIKKYTVDGFNKGNIYNIKLNNAKSITVTPNEDIFILTENDKIIQLDVNGNLLNTFEIQTLDDTARRIQISHDSNFIYITLDNHISKLTVDGKFAGIFNGIGNNNYFGIYNNEAGDLYITNEISILKFNDELYFVEYKSDINEYLWGNNDSYIKKNEFIDAWVYNRCFHRFFDNLEIYRRSLYGKPLLRQKDINLAEGSILSVLKYIDIRAFTALELQNFNYQKNDIYIGINELVTPDVVNRCLYQLYQNQLWLLSLIKEEIEGI